MKRFGMLAAILLLIPSAPAAGQDLVSDALTVLGLPSEEEIDEETLSVFESLASRPLDLNGASYGQLLSSGLFTRYQLASLEDYRRMHGDVLSFEELSSLDGFGRAAAGALRRFVSLERRAGGVSELRLSAELRGDVNGERYSLRGKLLCEGYRGLRLFMSRSPSATNLSLSYSPSGTWKVLAGDFNVRFGQGLVLWSGMFMGGIPAPASLARRPSALSAGTSYGTTCLRGLAGSFKAGRTEFCAVAAFPWLRTVMDGRKAARFSMIPALNASMRFRSGSVSLNAAMFIDDITQNRLSVDWRFCSGGVDWYGETVLYPFPAANAGLCFRLRAHRMAVQGRFYPSSYPRDFVGAFRSGTNPSDELSLTLVFGDASSVYGADISRRVSDGRMQLKIQCSDLFTMSESFSLRPRISCRLRSSGERPRTDVRADLIWRRGRWSNVVRLNGLHCAGYSAMAYSETSFTDGGLALHLRAMLFMADNWDDRIYAYERRVPGSFSIPALYGRGYRLNMAAVGKMRPGKRTWLKTCMSAFLTAYPWNWGKEKPGKAGLELSAVIDF